MERKAKFILFEFSTPSQERFTAVNHLAMTGIWLFRKSKMPLHSIFSLTFSEDKTIDFVDKRKFGRFNVYKTDEFWSDKKLQRKFSDLGPDILSEESTPETFSGRVKKYQNWEIKPLLMEQNFVSGIGNIYASEICFLSGLNPFRKVSTLNVEEWEKIAVSAKLILQRAYEAGGSSIEDYQHPDGSLGRAQNDHLIYNKRICGLCKSQISKSPQKSRITYWCPKCQKW